MTAMFDVFCSEIALAWEIEFVCKYEIFMGYMIYAIVANAANRFLHKWTQHARSNIVSWITEPTHCTWSYESKLHHLCNVSWITDTYSYESKLHSPIVTCNVFIVCIKHSHKLTDSQAGEIYSPEEGWLLFAFLRLPFGVVCVSAPWWVFPPL